MVTNHEGVYYLNLAEVICVKNDNSYSSFETKCGETIIVSQPLRNFEEKLVKAGFIRANQSAMINLEYIVRIEKNEMGCRAMLSVGKPISISRNRKVDFISMMKKYSLDSEMPNSLDRFIGIPHSNSSIQHSK